MTAPKPEAPELLRAAGPFADIMQVALALSASPAQPSFQDRVKPWMMACFGAEISSDRLERGDRLLEEVFELLQSGSYPQERVTSLTSYVWSRPIGEPAQEVGGVMVTLAAYCLAYDLDMHSAGETELARIWTKVDKIRAKQAAKPTGSALPQAWPSPAPVADAEDLREAIAAIFAEDDPFVGIGASSYAKADRVLALRQQPAPQSDEAATLRAELAEAVYRADQSETALARLVHDLGVARAALQAEKDHADAARDVLAERQRQITAEGWTPEHDDEHGDSEMAEAALCYIDHAIDMSRRGTSILSNRWPWQLRWWKPTAPRRDLVKAGALILAEIERLDRHAAHQARRAGE